MPGRALFTAVDRMILLGTQEVRFAEADGNDVWLDTDRGRLRAPGRGLACSRTLTSQGSCACTDTSW